MRTSLGIAMALPRIGEGPLGGSVSFVASATSLNSATVTIPASAQAGDLAVLLDASSASTTAPTTVVPDGWTPDVNSFINAATAMRSIISHKVLVGGEPGTSVTGMDSSTDRKIMLVFRPSRPIASVIVSTPTAQIIDTDPASQQILMAGAAPPGIAIAHWRSNGAVSPRSASPALAAEVTSDSVQFAQYSMVHADYTIDMDDEGGANCLQGLFYRLTF